MRVLGENFYNMQAADEIVIFEVGKVEAVMLQPVEIDLVNMITEEIAETMKFSLVLVLLNDGTWLSTRPDLDAAHAERICKLLSDWCEKYHSSKLN